MSTLLYDSLYAQPCFKRCTQGDFIVNFHDAIAARTLLRLVRSLELNEVWPSGRFLAELQPTSRNAEVRIALLDDALVGGAEIATGRQ